MEDAVESASATLENVSSDMMKRESSRSNSFRTTTNVAVLTPAATRVAINLRTGAGIGPAAALPQAFRLRPQLSFAARWPGRGADLQRVNTPIAGIRRCRTCRHNGPPRTAGGRELSVPTQNRDLRGEWRRRESNPRPRTHRREPLQACPALHFRPAAGGRRPTDGLAILWSPAPGDWLSLGGEPVGWRRIPSHGPKTERRRYLTRLGGECEIVLRTCFVPGCFTRPTGDLGLQLFRRTDHVETRSPPDAGKL